MKVIALLVVGVICNCSSGTIVDRGDNSKKFLKPCFDGEEIENTCSEPSDSCHEKLGNEFKLVRLDGVKVKYLSEIQLKLLSYRPRSYIFTDIVLILFSFWENCKQCNKPTGGIIKSKPVAG